ncbi:hypothetical protein RU07_21730 [Agrobacterium tumefaciens]|uniref:Ti plasmid pTi15955 T-DNA region n=1 Tax=Agrobacterium tumefaciens TaxID=358 RepID=A0A0D0J193_AGRTU|nr:hypothetical protein RU07_21730 [Agrobacterium tumefaciens]
MLLLASLHSLTASFCHIAFPAKFLVNHAQVSMEFFAIFLFHCGQKFATIWHDAQNGYCLID